MKYDAVVVGGGFYGANIALYLKINRGLKRILIIEKEQDLISRASELNQARVHNGYHYPRNIQTGSRSRLNSRKFINAFAGAIYSDFQSVYAIANRMSLVSGSQFKKFCDSIGAPYKPATQSIKKLFVDSMVDEVLLVDETTFNFELMRKQIWCSLRENDIDVWLNSEVISIEPQTSKLITKVRLDLDDTLVESRYVFNCAYSGLNKINGPPSAATAIKHEIVEMCVVKPVGLLADLGITIMDGPFFSLIPYPAKGAHTLSHVRYTPHFEFNDNKDLDPYSIITQCNLNSNYKKMLGDACRFLPSIVESVYLESLYEVKTVLLCNEINDGRPILFEKSESFRGLYFILGGKIDNIYDIFEKLEMEDLSA